MTVRLYAHRGAAAELPENTLPSFERALEVGADALETDVHQTRDGVIVASHDPDGLRMCGVPLALKEATWDEVARWDAGVGFAVEGGHGRSAGGPFRIPRLVDLLRAFPGVRLNVDLKVDVAEAAVKLIRDERAEDRVCLASFQSSTLRKVRQLGYAGDTGLGRDEVARLLALPAALHRRVRSRLGTAAQLPLSLARPWVIARCQALGLRVDFWTVNDAATAQRLVALGADGIMTDDPRRIAPVVRAASKAAR